VFRTKTRLRGPRVGLPGMITSECAVALASSGIRPPGTHNDTQNDGQVGGAGLARHAHFVDRTGLAERKSAPVLTPPHRRKRPRLVALECTRSPAIS